MPARLPLVEVGSSSLFLVAGILLTLGLTRQPGHERMTEIDVERINLVEPDGRIRMVIANSARSPRVLHRGEAIGRPAGGRPGIVFYNDEQTENGGLTFSGKTENGRTTSVGSLTFDQYERDQTLALQVIEDGGTRRAGLSILDYPGPTTAALYRRLDSIQSLPEGPGRSAAQRRLQEDARARPRVYVGRSRHDGAARVSLHDAGGVERLRMVVDSVGRAGIEFLDDSGRVARRIAAD